MNDHANGNDPVVSQCLRRSVVLCLLAAAGCMVPAVADDGPRPASPAAAPSSSAVPNHWRGTPAEKEVAWLLDDVLGGRSADYRAAVEEVLQRQARFCDGADRLDRVTVCRASKDDGTTTLSLESRPGRNGHGDSHSAAMTLRDGATLEMSGVRGPPLTFEPFLRLRRLTKLELNDCDVAASCAGAGHPSLERIRIAGSGPRELTLRDMPRLSHVSIWKAGQLEAVTLIDCPALKSCDIGQSPNLTKLDLREARAKADVDTSLSNIDKRLILRPDPTAEPGAKKTP